MVEQVAAIKALRSGLAAFGGAFDPSVLLASDCQTVMREAAVIEKIAATIVAMAAARVSETDLWRRNGDRTAAHALARETGQTVNKAKEQLDTAQKLRGLPAVDEAARTGELSKDQAAAIADAAAADPAAEKRLVDAAKTKSLAELRDECGRTKAAADKDPDATRRRIHRQRRLRTFIDAEGGWNLHVRNTPDAGAEIMACLQPIWDALFNRARTTDTREPTEAYGADALLEAMRLAHANTATATPPPAPSPPQPSEHEPDVASTGIQPPTVTPRPPVKIIVRVDLPTVVRGYPIEGETCDIVGIGPISVSAIRDLMASSPFLAAVITAGQQVAGVAHLGRRANAVQQTALEWSQPTCTVDGCPCTAHLETDHNDEFQTVRETELSNLDRLCTFHHALKTRENWALTPGTGKRAMVPPTDPRHPDRVREAVA